MNKYLSRATSSARGENFNPLTYPFLIATLAYGIGFLAFGWTDAVQLSSLFVAMNAVAPGLAIIWGGVCVLTIIVGLTFLLFNIPPAGRVSGLVGFMLWVFAAFCWGLDGAYLLLFSVALPNMWFWIWQYLSLSLFRREDAEDKVVLKAYHDGEYDDDNGGEALRLLNRGRDLQKDGHYVNPDDGGDSSRPVDEEPVI